jgi:ATP-dependent helicase/nuclease subunit A
MIKLAIGKMSEIPEKIKHIRHVLLDEAQDTSSVQWKLIYSLAMEVLQFDNSSFTVVGDKKQVIYEFNGASKSVFEYMKNKLRSSIRSLDGEWREYDLSQSYRSPQVLLDFIDTVMQGTKYQTKHTAAKNLNGFIKTWLPLKNEKENLMMDRGWKIPSNQTLPEWINLCVGEIKQLLDNTRLLNENRPIRPSDIMLLIPRRCINTFLLVEELKKNGIPIAESPFSIITDETIQELVGIGELVLDMSNDLLLASILKGPYFKWTNEQIEAISIDREDTLWNTMCNLKEKHIVEAVNVFNKWSSVPKDLFTFYSEVLFGGQYGSTILKECRNEAILFWEQVIQNSGMTLAEFVHKMKNSHDPVRINRDGVIISTVHCSKGREANIIFLCSSHSTLPRNLPMHIMHENILLLKGNYSMYKNAKNKSLMDQESESDRLMYVAMSRAKEQIYFLLYLLIT